MIGSASGTGPERSAFTPAVTCVLTCVLTCLATWLALRGEAQAWCQMTTGDSTPSPGSPCEDEGIPLAWERRCISYSIDARGSKDYELDRLIEVVDASFGAWLDVECDGVPLDFEVQRTERPSMCAKAEYNTDDGNVNTVAFVTDWPERGYDPLAYALTTVWHNTSSGRIYDADIEVNENRGEYTDCPTPDGCTDGRIDLRNVLTHEAGHFFGLGHTQSSHTFATMYAISPPGEVGKRVLRTDDITGICTMYPPGSLPEECNFTPRHGLELDCETEGCCSAAPGAPGPGSSWAIVLIAGVLVTVRWRGRRTGRGASPPRRPPAGQRR